MFFLKQLLYSTAVRDEWRESDNTAFSCAKSRLLCSWFQKCGMGTTPGEATLLHTLKVKVKVVVYSPDIHDYACSTDFTVPLARRAPMQPATIDPTLDLCTRYLLQLGGPRQYGIQSLPHQTPDLLILSPTPYPFGLVFPLTCVFCFLFVFFFVFFWGGEVCVYIVYLLNEKVAVVWFCGVSVTAFVGCWRTQDARAQEVPSPTTIFTHVWHTVTTGASFMYNWWRSEATQKDDIK